MQIFDCPIPGLKTIQLKVHGDARGFFIERFHAGRFAEMGLPTDFSQDNHSRSAPGILRGLHFQHTPPQGKLVGVINGRIWDIAVDIRKDSATFGQYHAVELSGENGLLLWIPAGFAHGFCVLGDEPADILYKVTGQYNPAGEGGISYNDPELNIPWPIKNALVSERDQNLQSWSQYRAGNVGVEIMRYAYVNGEYVPHSQAAVHIEDRGYQFSDGIYEYVAFYNGRLVDAALHFRRLERSLREIEIPMPMLPGPLAVIVRELIERNGKEDGGLYIQVTRGVAKRDHAFPKHIRPSLVMTVCGAKLPSAQQVNEGVKVITQPDIRWGRRDIKSISLLPNILAKQKAAEVGAREAWLVDDKIVSEGSASNSYIVTKAGQVVTHPANNFILGGITREVVLRLAQKAGIPVAEKAFTITDVKNAAEAFLTSTSANVLPVVKVDAMIIGKGKPGPVTQKLNALYIAHIFKETGRQL